MTNKLTISQKALHEQQRKAKEAHPAPKPPRRENTFSKSRDIREDRDTRQMKNTRKADAFPRAK
jgi:hypothetical protein